MVTLTGGQLATVTCGEHRESEKDWVVPVTRQIFRVLSLIRIGSQNGTQYWHYAVRKLLGFVLFPLIFIRIKMEKTPRLPYSIWAGEDRRIIQAADPNARPMRGIPTPKALKFFSGIPLFSRFFEDLVADQIRKIVSANPETVIQFELPAELAFTSAPLGSWWQQRIARRMAGALERVIRQSPEGTRFAFHLCWGDLNRQPFVPKFLQSNIAKVILINAIAKLSVWSEGWTLFAIHDPLCDGVNDPATDDRGYDAYWALVPLPEDTRYALGILRKGFNATQTHKVARMLMERLETKVRLFALAPPCGDGRKPLEEVEEQYATGREVLKLLGAA